MVQSSTVRGFALSTIMVCAFATSAMAGDAPAVSEINGKVAIVGTYNNQDNQDGEFGGLFLGSITAPAAPDLGFQADTVLGTRDGNEVAGAGGHLFWRDPTIGLAGLTASYLFINNSHATPDQSVARFGGEGELYLDQFTVAVTSGIQRGYNVDDGYYGSATGYWYANDDLRLSLGATNDPVLNTAAIAGIEYQPRAIGMSGLTFFADASAGANDYTTAQIGVRFYFGSDKSLKQRNRQDDPIANLPGDSIASAAAAVSTPDNAAERECNARSNGWFWNGSSCDNIH